MLKEEAQVIFGDFEYALTRLKNSDFDIIFLDPPYNFKDIKKILDTIKANNVLAPSGIVIFESLYEKDFDKNVDGYKIIKSKKYGITAIDIYEAE